MSVMRENGVRQVLASGRIAIGQLVKEFTSRGIALVLESGNIDYVMIDTEHGGIGPDRLADLLIWFRGTRVTPFVRIAGESISTIPSLLDSGAMGVFVANIQSAEQVRAVVQEARYPPLGRRGIALSGPHTDYRSPKMAEYMDAANANVMLGVAIESAEGLAEVDAIAAVDGLDIVTLAHSDLSNRMGIHMEMDHPRFKKAVVDVIEACKRRGKIGRIYPTSDAKIVEYQALGYRMMMLPQSDIGLYRGALLNETERFRRLLSQ